MDLDFKSFVELYERQPNYLDSLQDELGIDPKAFEKNPEWAANIKLGNISYNGVMYKIDRLIYKNGNISGAMISPQNIVGNKTQRAYFNKGDKKVRIPDSSVSTSPTYINIDTLNNILSQGLTAGGGGEQGGMLPGGGM